MDKTRDLALTVPFDGDNQAALPLGDNFFLERLFDHFLLKKRLVKILDFRAKGADLVPDIFKFGRRRIENFAFVGDDSL
jgi:hypothetical protein